MRMIESDTELSVSDNSSYSEERAESQSKMDKLSPYLQVLVPRKHETGIIQSKKQVISPSGPLNKIKLPGSKPSKKSIHKKKLSRIPSIPKSEISMITESDQTLNPKS